MHNGVQKHRMYKELNIIGNGTYQKEYITESAVEQHPAVETTCYAVGSPSFSTVTPAQISQSKQCNDNVFQFVQLTQKLLGETIFIQIVGQKVGVHKICSNKHLKKTQQVHKHKHPQHM